MDYDNSPVLDMYVKEILRLYGPSTISHYRVCTRTHKLNGITVKKHTKVGFAPVGFHKDPSFHENPLFFNMDRFSEENIKNVQRRTFIPFGEGNRKCSGVYLGYNLVKLTLVSLLSHFEIQKQEDFDPKWMIQFAIEMPKVVMKLRPR